VREIRRLQKLLGLSLAEIKEMVEAEEALKQIRAEYRRDADVEEKLDQLQRAMAVTEKQYAIIHQKLEQLRAMSDQLEKRLATYRTWQANLEAQRQQAATPR
ncbi:MAG: hypothetical protein K6U88_16675, partial [Dehalococcoidia bacterium]|nr:hypothetical protein [Dehalococcoidia bacterium]